MTAPSYTALTADEFVAHILDDGGLVRFVELQTGGTMPEDSDWAEITRRIWHLSTDKCPHCGAVISHRWQPTPASVEGLYATQKAALAA